MKGMLFRWLKFNLVGALGVCLQLSALTVLVSALGMNYLLATGVAVELTVLHNFVWHEYFTWRDRTHVRKGRLLRSLFSFHAANGMVSLVGNLFLMRLLVGVARLPYALANFMAIVGCSIINFLLAELVVFIAAPPRRIDPAKQ